MCLLQFSYLDSLVLSSAALSCTRQHEKEITGRISYWCAEKHFYILKKKHVTQLRPRRILSLPGLTRLQTSPNLCTNLLSSRKVFQTGLSINYLRILDSPVRSVYTINFFKIYKTEALITSHRNNGG